MRLSCSALAIALAVPLAAAGCVLPDPVYDGTEFSCVESPYDCPDGFSCDEGVCVKPAVDPPDAGPQVALPDAATGGEPDAEPTSDPSPITLSFGERPGADVSGVTTDSTLRHVAPNANFGDLAQVATDADPTKYAVIRFDVSSLPANAVIVAAQLEVYVPDPIETGVFQGFQLLESWSEGQVTWNDRADGLPWGAAGAEAGSYSPVVVAQFAPREIGMAVVDISPAVVQIWASSSQLNHGLKWMSTSPDGRGGDFESRDSSQAELRPLLRVTYR